MLQGENAVNKCGFVPAHAKAFKKVATDLEVVIVSRAVNVLSTGLLIEDYAAKGFHIKAKSCNFGPMAGFVCLEPEFSKNGPAAAEKQAKANKESIEKHKCGAVPLVISTARLEFLVKEKLLTQTKEKDGSLKLTCVGNVPKGLEGLVCIAKPAGKDQWALYIAKDVSKIDEKTLGLIKYTVKDELIPIFGMSNPTDLVKAFGQQPKDHKRAVAGDYDLFCLAPRLGSDKAKWINRPAKINNLPTLMVLKAKNREKSYEALIDDLCELPQKTRDELAKTFKLEKLDKSSLVTLVKGFKKETEIDAFHKAVKIALANVKEDQHLGNITVLGKIVKEKMNTAAHQTGYRGGFVVMHSDDSGNPFSDAPDYPLLAFVPDEEPWGIENKDELEEFYTALLLSENKRVNKAGKLYDVTLNPNWF